MPFTSQQLIRGADYTLNTFARVEPVDSINTERTTLKLFVDNKVESTYGNGVFANPVYMDNGSNTQRYFGADQVTYNERDPVRQAKFYYYNLFEGFYLDEDRLAANNIILSEDGMEAPTTSEKEQLVNLLKECYRASTNSLQDTLAFDTLRDGTQSTKAVPGLDLLVSTTPTVGTVGELAASNSWWQNNISLGIAQGDLLIKMEAMWRACIRYGGKTPNAIRCGAAFLDDYRAACKTDIGREIVAGGNVNGGVGMDGAVTELRFRGVPLIWDPMFERLDSIVGAISHPWTKRCYFLNTNTVKLRPLKRSWMRRHKPERLPDRFVHYYGWSTKYGMTLDQRNNLAVLSID